MTTWTKTFTREPPKTKAQLREMLTEAFRNTRPEPKRLPKTERDRGYLERIGVPTARKGAAGAFDGLGPLEGDRDGTRYGLPALRLGRGASVEIAAD